MKYLYSLCLILGIARYQVYAQNEQKDAASASNHFGWDIYQKLSSQGNGNLFFSPFGISSALAMTYAGAKEQTAKEMEQVLYFKDFNSEINKQYKTLIAELAKQQHEKEVELNVANALWGEKSIKFLPEFTHQLKAFYNSDMHKMDYKKDAEKSRKEINHWVEKQTNHKIKDLLAQGVITDRTRLVLTNALYFKAGWASVFPNTNTRTDDFWVSKDQKEETSLMNITKKFRYKEAHGAQVLEVAYQYNEFSMIFILPQTKAGLLEWEKNITFEQYADLLYMKETDYTNVVATIPKFKITASFSLKDLLSDLGMEQAFTEEADFSGMTGTKDLKIDDVIHKAYIEVMEKGTEAAAATAVVVGAKSASINKEDDLPKYFRADHPFIFVIKDNNSGTVLFMGKYLKP